MLAEVITRVGAALVIIDPLVAAQNAAIDSHRQAAMRSILQPLHNVAQDTGAAIVFTVHLRKSASDNVLYRACGSIDLVAAVRTAIAVGRDPNNPARRGAAVFKSNLAEFPEPVAFRLENGRMLIEPGTAPNLTADKLLGPPAGSEERSAVDEAADFLRELLAAGPVEARGVIKEAKAAGIADITLRRAKAALGVRVIRQGSEGRRGGGAGVWVLGDQNDHGQPNTYGDHLNRDGSSPTAPRDCGHGINMINDHLNPKAANPTAPRDSGVQINMIIESVRPTGEGDHLNRLGEEGDGLQ